MDVEQLPLRAAGHMPMHAPKTVSSLEHARHRAKIATLPLLQAVEDVALSWHRPSTLCMCPQGSGFQIPALTTEPHSSIPSPFRQDCWRLDKLG